MNWTEGNLARHSRSKQSNEVLKRQKQHFSKARSRILNGSVKKSPIKISFLSSEHVQRPHRCSKDYSSSPTGFLATPDQGLARSSKQGTISLSCDDIRSSKASRRRWDQETVPASQDGHSVKNRKRFILADIFNEEQSREKRRKLLMKADWAGLEMQQPIDLSFPGQIQASSGRLWSKPNTVKQRSTHKLEAIRHHVRENKDACSRQVLKSPSEGVGISPIRIHIGSQSATHRTDSDSRITEERTILPIYTNQRESWNVSAGKSRLRGIQHYGEANNSISGTDKYFTPMVTTSQHHVFEDIGRGNYPQDRPEHIVYASSEIYQPTPRRIESSKILYRSPSFNLSSGESVCAEIGEPKHRHSSEIADSKQWLDNLGPSENLVIPLARSSSLLESPQYRPNISPGISEASSRFNLDNIEQPKESTVDSSSLVAENAPSLEGVPWPSHVEEIRIQEGIAKPSEKSHIGASDTASSRPIDWVRTCQQEKATAAFSNSRDSVKLQSIATRSQESSLPHSPDKKNQVRTISQVKNILNLPEDDENAAWMKFIFGTRDNDLEVYQEAVQHVAEELKPSEELSIDSTEASNFDGSSSNSRNVALILPDVSSDVESNEAIASGSVITNSSQSTFRFALPRTFIGKLAESGLISQEMPPPPAPAVQGKLSNRTRSRKGSGKKICDGRTNIRALPDFDGDPIEE